MAFFLKRSLRLAGVNTPAPAPGAAETIGLTAGQAKAKLESTGAEAAGDLETQFNTSGTFDA